MDEQEVDTQETYISFQPGLPCAICKKEATVGMCIQAELTDVDHIHAGDYVLTPFCKECSETLYRMYHEK